jgi:hypothetical protein
MKMYLQQGRRLCFGLLAGFAIQSPVAMAADFNTVCAAGTTCNYTNAVETWQYAMTCNGGTRLNVLSATFGTSTASRSCLSYVSSVCSGKSSCMLTFSSASCGGDPAPGASKRGAATVSCGNGTSTPTPTPTPSTARLTAQMYANRTLSGSPTVTKPVSQVNFALQSGSPDPAIPADNYSMRVTGSFVANETGAHVFYLSLNDGARMSFNGRQVINEWRDGYARTRQFSANLEAGRSYPLTIDYYERTGSSELKLAYSTSRVARTIVPAARFASGETAPTPEPQPEPQPQPEPIPTTPPTGQITLKGNKVYDKAGVQIVARGPEITMADRGTLAVIDEMANAGANAMRVLLTLDAINGMTPAIFEEFLAKAASRRMLVWVSLYTWDENRNHVIGDALGGGNFYNLQAPAGTGACSHATPAACYLAVWQRPWLKNLVAKYRANVIVDAAQEYIGRAPADTEAGQREWAEAAKVNLRFFRSQGYTNPLEFMTSFQGRDLYAIVKYGPEIRALDTVRVDGDPQTMFGWQAYWGTSNRYYNEWQGSLFYGSGVVLETRRAFHDIVTQQSFPIQIGLDNYGGDTNLEYRELIDQASVDRLSWLWWDYRNGGVDCPVSGQVCRDFVTHSPNGFAGAKKLSQ